MTRYRQHLLTAFGSILGVASLAGCSDIRSEFTESVCQDGTLMLLQQLQPAESVDYVALLRSYGPGAQPPTLVEEAGTCPASANCEELEVNPEEQGMRRGNGWDGSTQHLAYVRDDVVGKLMSVDEVRAFLGTIDTPGEAVLLAYLSGYDIDCEGPHITELDNGYLLYAETGDTCGGDIHGHQLFVGEDGSIEERDSTIVEHGTDECAIGRIPAGLQSSAGTTCDGVGPFFARVAHLEAASVAAFEDLAAELEHHGAPAGLRRRARRAAREETRHAILTGALARRYGARRSIPRVRRQSPRSLEAIATDNAIEGLGRETYGALVGHHQALHAADPVVRKTMQLIAADETRHAELSFMLHGWLSKRLSKAARKRVRRARREALTQFRTTLCREPHPDTRRLAGVPSAAQAQRMFDRLFAELA